MVDLNWTIGDARVTRVEEAVTPVPATALMPAFTADHLDPHREWAGRFFGPDDELLLSVHSFIVESGDTTIVVDTCVGPDPERPLPSDETFPDRLAAAISGGLAAVDVVLCTHMHFDHVGWNLRVVDGKRVPTFPNARYLFSQTEMDHLDAEDHMAVRDPSVQPLIDAGLVDLVAMDHRITDEVRLLPTPGHTPGHVSVLIESGASAGLITGDMAHSPLQFALPELAAAAFDWDSEMSAATRRDVTNTYTNTPTVILGTHFAPPTAGHIRSEDDRVWFES